MSTTGTDSFSGPGVSIGTTPLPMMMNASDLDDFYEN